MGERSIITTPEWAHWFLEVEDHRLSIRINHGVAEFHTDLNSVINALNGGRVWATLDVIAELMQHPYPKVGDRCEIMMLSNVLIRLTRVQ